MFSLYKRPHTKDIPFYPKKVLKTPKFLIETRKPPFLKVKVCPMHLGSQKTSVVIGVSLHHLFSVRGKTFNPVIIRYYPNDVILP